MTLRRRLGLVALAYVVLLILGAVFSFGSAAARFHHAEAARRFQTGVERTLRLQTAYVDMETGERGFLIGGEATFLEPYDRGTEMVAALGSDLMALKLDPTLRSSLEATMAAGQRWTSEVAEPEIAARRQLGEGAAAALATTGKGKALFDDLRAKLATLQTQLIDRADVEFRARESAARRLTVVVVIAPVAGLLVTLAAAVLANRWVVHPMEDLVFATRKLRDGNLLDPIPSGGAPDVAGLGRRIDEMRQTIRRQIDNEVRAREAIEQSAVLAVQLRSQLASDLGLLPEGWSAAADLLPAEGYVAGDCYDVGLVSPTHLGVVVLDISGHGAGPGLMALRCKEIVRAALGAGLQPGAALALLSEQMGDLAGSFLSAFVAVIDTATAQCSYANAGHPPALLSTHDEIVGLDPTGPIVGPLPNAVWATRVVEIERGGCITIYTDGLTEARDASGEFYGTSRLEATMMAINPMDPAGRSLRACFDDLHEFRPGRLVDDVTVVMVCRAIDDDAMSVADASAAMSTSAST